jgi:hypothetical protein
MKVCSSCERAKFLRAGVSAANDTTESLSETAEEQKRTAQFAQDILSLLVVGDTKEGKAE